MTAKICLFCVHFDMNTGEPDWSDITPGSDFSMDCAKNKWTSIDVYDRCSIEEYRTIMLKAEKCDEFSPVEGYGLIKTTEEGG